MSLQQGGHTWEHVHVDPTAGVALWPRMLYCPRCGGVKGRAAHDRPGLCTDCREVVPRAEWASWRPARSRAA